ncbi:MAG: hypothetical protein EXS37_14065 [Opitutus sp.]|nr:hypothetical protein [Opitutus sp.]
MHTTICHFFRIALVLLIAGTACAQGAGLRTFTITPSAGGAAVVQITLDGPRIKISSGNDVILTGDTKDAQKRRYAGKGGAFAAEVKMGESDGFKMRNATGLLLWKIKTAGTKTKVSDNEEN